MRLLKIHLASLFFASISVFSGAQEVLREKLDINECISNLKSHEDLKFESANQCLYDAIPENTPVLLKEMLENQEPIVRGRLAMLFAKRQVKEAIPGIIKLVDDKEMPAKKWAVYALNDLSDARAVPVLMKTIHESDYWLQTYSISAILKMRGFVSKKEIAETKEVLVLNLRNPKEIVRESAVRHLGKMEDASVIPLIESLMHNDTYFYISNQIINGRKTEVKVFPVRDTAMKAVKQIRGQRRTQ